MNVIHPFEPVFDSHSRVLVLGSVPSVKSRENGFYYGHPQNRFWRVISCICMKKISADGVAAVVQDVPVPVTVMQKKSLLLNNRIALWDVVAGCEISGSSDSSIKNAVPNNLDIILSSADIKAVFANGTAAYNLYMRLCSKTCGCPVYKLPSTSPANAAFTTERLVSEWKFLTAFL